ncbi:serine hydrolase domain-containing protein [Steroidobacter cummioxidans]|uniref:serine hydrolase domain-containing protein n=1 Tax=Steroidobacter cummioxidans TaxID=1803913 RepID=UPI001379CD56|nr:serine hydrolase domain-containing protein [Steroidobacter cummioxidans]
MRQTAALILAALLNVTGSTSVLASSAPEAPADASALEAFVDGAIRPLMKNHNSPAGTLAIVKNGRLVLAKGYGFQDVERRIPVDPARSLFRAGSVSKVFTWVSVMQLVEQGKLDLDRDINSYLRDFEIDAAFGQPITLRHIMTHTAGFEDGRVGYLVVDKVQRLVPLAEAMRRYQPMRVNPPGVQTSYSNYATALAGLIVANVSGMSYNEYVARHIFDVLRMEHSTFDEPLPESLVADMTQPYMAAQGRYQRGYFELISAFGPAGALSTTATDMARFAQAILNGGELEGQRILQRDTVEQMLTRVFAQDERLMGMGLGFYEKDINGTRVWGHAGAMPFFHSDLVIDRQHDLAFFTSFAAFGGAVVNAAFSQAFYDQYYPAALEPTPIAPEDFGSRAERFAGTYLPWRASFSKFEKVRELVSNGLRVVPMPDRTLLLVADTGAKRYVEVEHNLFKEQSPDIVYGVAASRPRLMAFQEDAGGNITGLALDGRPYTSSYKAALHQTGRFSKNLVSVSTAIFVAVLLGALGRRIYQRPAVVADRRARRIALACAAVNLAVLGFGATVLPKVLLNEYAEFSTAFRIFMWAPFLVVITALLMLWQTTLAWRHGTLSGWWERIRYSAVMLSCLCMCWFYWYWNLLGPRYFG